MLNPPRLVFEVSGFMSVEFSLGSVGLGLGLIEGFRAITGLV